MARTRTAAGPVRTCIGCRARAATSELLRVTARLGVNDQWVVAPDPGRTARGRGAHLHPEPACYDLAVRRKAFSRALRRGGALPADAVGEYLAGLAGESDARPEHDRTIEA